MRTRPTTDRAAKAGGRAAGGHGRDAGGRAAGASEPAQAGSQGPLPLRAEMERAFGVSFADVSARTAADDALDPIGAAAATRGQDVLFRSAHPGPGQVAHELTHVLQQRRGGSGGGMSAPGSAAEREAARNALRVDLGLKPRQPQERASPDAVYRDVKSDLRDAMRGWGTDEEAIYGRLGRASPDEKSLVRSDPALMAELQDELTRDEWVRALNLLGLGVESQITAASSGWGTDEEGIYRAVETATVPALKDMINNGAVLLQLRDELTDGELGRVLATVAGKYYDDPLSTFAESYHVMMLWPDSVDEACDVYDRQRAASGGVVGLIGFLPAGHTMPAGTVADVDTHIANDGNFNRVVAAFRRRWNLQTGQALSPTGGPTTFTAGTHTDWSVSRVRQLHRALQQVPPGHVARAGQNISSIGIDPNTTAGGYWSASLGMIGLNRNPGNLDAVTRHEVGHSIDDRLGAVSTTFKQNAINGWRWGISAATWSARMPNPWLRKDGSQVPAADQVNIVALLDRYIRTDGSVALRNVTGTGAAEIAKYWGDDVPMIEAARALAGHKDKVWETPRIIKQYGSFYFSWSAYYHEFYVYRAIVQDQRVSNYSLFGHPEFFAELYEAYYENGPGPQRGRRLAAVPSWKAFFDNTVHGVA